MSTEQKELTVWQKQEQLRQWHDREYKQAYPDSTFYTGKALYKDRGKGPYESLPQVEKDRKEGVAYRLNSMLFSIGVNVGPFEGAPQPAQQTIPAYGDDGLGDLEDSSF